MRHQERTPTAPFWLWVCVHSCRFCVLFRLWGPQPPGSNAMTWGGAYVIITEINCTINVRHLNYQNHSPLTPSPWKKCLPWNWFLVPKRLGTTDVEGCLMRQQPLSASQRRQNTQSTRKEVKETPVLGRSTTSGEDDSKGKSFLLSTFKLYQLGVQQAQATIRNWTRIISCTDHFKE